MQSCIPTSLPNQLLQVFHTEMNHLKQTYKKLKKEAKDSSDLILAYHDDFSLFVEWANYFHHYHEEELHLPPNELNSSLQQKSYQSLKKDFLKTFVPQFLQSLWPIRFTDKFLRKLETLREEATQICVLDLMKTISDGYFGRFPILLLQALPYMVYFKLKVCDSNIELVVVVHIEQLPEFDKQKRLKSFKYIHVVRFLDLLLGKEKGTIMNVCDSFLEDYKKNPVRKVSLSKHPENFLENLEHKYKIKKNFFTYCFEEKMSEKEGFVPLSPFLSPYPNKEYSNYIFLPSCFETNYLKPEEADQFVFDCNLLRWVSNTTLVSSLKKQENVVISKINSEILSGIADFDSSSKLVKLLEKIESMKLKLTTEEKNLIGQSGNVLAIGRSGTGKTTCCVLRLFSQEMLFKIRVSQTQRKSGVLMDTRATANHFGELTGIHSIFVTASPVLANEVQRYYCNLNTRVNEEIKAKERKTRDLNKKIEEKSLELSAINISRAESEISFENIELNSQINEEISSPTQTITKNEEDDENEEEEDLLDNDEGALDKFEKNFSLDNIEDKEFPLFLTLKKIILMIDGTLKNPFFLRRNDKSIIGSNINAEWHNETKGLMMINEKYKTTLRDEIDDQPDPISAPSKNKEQQKEGLNDTVNLDETVDVEDETDFMNTSKIREKSDIEDEKNRQNKMKFEIDYNYFYNHFWQGHLSNTERAGNISAIRLWSEILSCIKGSEKSHLYPGYCLPIEVYCSTQLQGVTLLNTSLRKEIYNLYLSYERWKQKEGGYDFMDVVNHILNELEFDGYQGTRIHFTLIDEVQDLSHATILLLMMITEQSIFFAGDTAQTIAKGVGVRFANLSSLFKIKPEENLIWKMPTVHHLTVNFRSHSKILDMANSVVTLLETLFPRTIDKFKKEKSEIDGPKPILLEDIDIEVLFALLFGTENIKTSNFVLNQGENCGRSPIEFGCHQVIIVRDQESKQKLPPILKPALCLTIYEAKGLEFDDVVLYNFFSESPMPSKMWKLLSLLQIEEQELDKDTYDKYYFTCKDEKNKELSSLDIEQTDDRGTEKKKNQEDLDLQAPNVFNVELNAKNNKYIIKKVFLPKKYYSPMDFETYGMLCNELKQLYVGLTRPRNRLIIYDDNIENREKMEKYWKNLSLVQIINKKVLEQRKINTFTDTDTVEIIYLFLLIF